jgi:2,6-dihydroxypyridine 3-monooxygenase
MTRAIEDIIVVGGSHAGLFAAVALKKAGFGVRLFERAPEVLRGTGAGIRVQPLLADMLRRAFGIALAEASTRTRFDRHLAPRREAAGNRIVFEQTEDGQFASWGSLYRALLKDFGLEHYHCGESAVGAHETARRVDIRFASGRSATADLVVFADGIASPARRRLIPEARMQYSGYVAWRGLVPERDLSPETRAVLRDARIVVIAGLSHVMLYPVPGEADAVAEGERRFNGIWYRNVAEGTALDDLMTDREGTQRPTTVPEGAMQPRHVAAFRRDVEAELPPAVAEVLLKPEPFVTPIYDVEPSRMVFGRQVLLGDAAAATRPHVSASTAKAMRAAHGLAALLSDAATEDAVAERLDGWEQEHLAIAREFTRRGRAIGRRLQVDGTFVPGTPENTQITMPVDR